MKAEIKTWWESLTNEEQVNLIANSPMKDHWYGLDTQIESLYAKKYPSEHQEKSYTVEEAVEWFDTFTEEGQDNLIEEYDDKTLTKDELIVHVYKSENKTAESLREYCQGCGFTEKGKHNENCPSQAEFITPANAVNENCQYCTGGKYCPHHGSQNEKVNDIIRKVFPEISEHIINPLKDIRKQLFLERPTAYLCVTSPTNYLYQADLKSGYQVTFDIPMSDIKDLEEQAGIELFEKEMEVSLLMEWLKY